MARKKFRNACFLLVSIFGCVPIQQQWMDSESQEIEGFIGPLVTDAQEFNRIVFRGQSMKSEHDNPFIPLENCGCLSSPKIIQDKLIVRHAYSGGESNRERTKLYWNGKYDVNEKHQYIVNVILHSDKVDIRRAVIRDTKIHMIEALKRNDATTVWINLIGYEKLIPYNYGQK